jgi:hypothetical protein
MGLRENKTLKIREWIPMKGDWKPLGMRGALPAITTNVAPTIVEHKMPNFIRSSPERTSSGIADILAEETSRPIKEFSMKEAIRYSYLWDIRFLFILSTAVCIQVVLYWCLDPTDLNCFYHDPFTFEILKVEKCPFKGMGIPKCPFYEMVRESFLQHFFPSPIDWSSFHPHIQQKKIEFQ